MAETEELKYIKNQIHGLAREHRTRFPHFKVGQVVNLRLVEGEIVRGVTLLHFDDLTLVIGAVQPVPPEFTAYYRLTWLQVLEELPA